jgi:hypothetical protein
MPIETPTLITVSQTIRNNGPLGPVNVLDELQASAPPGCTISPRSETQLIVGLSVGASVTFDFEMLIECSEPSFHTFDFDNSISLDTPGVIDPDDSNNHLSSQFTIAVIAAADVAIISQSFVDLPSSIPTNSDVPITLRKVIRNNGPFGPVDIDVHRSVTAPSDCTVTPETAPTTLTEVPVGVDTSVDEEFTVNCSQASFHNFVFTNDISVSDPHVFDFLSDNNSDTVSLVIPFEEQATPTPTPTPTASPTPVALPEVLPPTGGEGPLGGKEYGPMVVLALIGATLVGSSAWTVWKNRRSRERR